MSGVLSYMLRNRCRGLDWVCAFAWLYCPIVTCSRWDNQNWPHKVFWSDSSRCQSKSNWQTVSRTEWAVNWSSTGDLSFPWCLQYATNSLHWHRTCSPCSFSICQMTVLPIRHANAYWLHTEISGCAFEGDFSVWHSPGVSNNRPVHDWDRTVRGKTVHTNRKSSSCRPCCMHRALQGPVWLRSVLVSWDRTTRQYRLTILVGFVHDRFRFASFRQAWLAISVRNLWPTWNKQWITIIIKRYTALNWIKKEAIVPLVFCKIK